MLNAITATAYSVQRISRCGIDAADAVEQALERRAEPVQERRLALVDPRHVGAERLGEREQDDDVEGELQIAVGGHSNHSGFSIATTR